MQFLDFELRVSRHEQGFEAHVLRSPAGEARHRFVSPFQQIELENLLLRLGRIRRGHRGGFDSDATRAAKQFGGQLYQAVFGGAVRSCFEASLREAQAGDACLRLRLRIEAPDFADVPWEYLYDAPQNRLLALSSTTSVVRYLELPSAARPVKTGKTMRVIVVIAGPEGYPELNAEKELANLKNAFRDLPGVEIVPVRPTVSALQACLRQGRAHVFHFIGHGDFDQNAGDGRVVFEDESGAADPVPSGKLAVLLHNHRDLSLAVLNCCEGARTDGGQPFSGVGPALVQQGLPAVVAMQFPIEDTAAISFAKTFYECIADGRAIERALVEARTAMYVAEDESFGAPVLYMRANGGVLFEPVNRPVPSPPAPVPLQQPVRAQTASPWARSVIFGIAWACVSVAAGAMAMSTMNPETFSFPGNVATWSRLAVALAAGQVGLFEILRSKREPNGSGFPAYALMWILASGLTAGVGAATAWLISSPRPQQQSWFVIAGYALVQVAMLRRHVSYASVLLAIVALTGAFVFVAIDFTTEFIVAASVLLMAQGVTLHRSTFKAAVSTPALASPAKISLLGSVTLLLLLLTTLLPFNARSRVPLPLSQAMAKGDVETIVAEITAQTGLAPNFVLQANPNARIAAAATTDEGRLLLYDPESIPGPRDAAGNDWGTVAILAHEVGHHLLGHVLDREISDRQARKQQLDADEFAGSVLFRFGATLDETVAAYAHFEITESSREPGRRERLEQLRKGWQRAEEQSRSR